MSNPPPTPAPIMPYSPFNSENWEVSTNVPLTQAEADARYLQLTGGILDGLVTFSAGLDSTLVSTAKGSASAPTFNFYGEPNCGIYNADTYSVGIACSGSNKMTISNSSITSSVPYLAPTGSTGGPSYAFSNNIGDGFYSSSSGSIGVSLNSVNSFSLSSTGITSALGMYLPNGNAANPAYSFSRDNDCGVFRVTNNTIGLAASGTSLMELSATGVYVVPQMLALKGSSTGPSYSFISDSDTGFYRLSSNNVGFCASGMNISSYSPSGANIVGPLSAGQPSILLSATGIAVVGFTGGVPYTLDDAMSGVNGPTQYWGQPSIVGGVSYGVNGIITINTSGTYDVSVGLQFGAWGTTSTLYRVLVVRNRSGVYDVVIDNLVNPNNSNANLVGSRAVSLIAGDTLQVQYISTGTGTSGTLLASSTGGTLASPSNASFIKVIKIS